MKWFACLISVCLGLIAAAPCAFSQTVDSSRVVEQEILAHEETDLTVLGKSRLVLMEALAKNDTAKARRVLQYMKSRFDTSKVVALLPNERVFVAYWMREYDDIFSLARGVYVDYQRYEKKLLPPRDLFYYDLKKKSQLETRRLAEGIRMSELPAYKKDFLFLFLKYIIAEKKERDEENAAEQKELNQAADEYLRSYPDAEFDPFVRQYIRLVMVRSDWGVGYEFSLGYLSLPAALGAHVKDFGLLTMALETAYRDVYAGLRLDIGAAHNTRKEFTYHGTWKEGLLVMQTGVLLSAGPRFELGNNFILTPQAGIGYYDFSPPQEESKKEGNDVSLSFAAWALGMNFDIPLTGATGRTYLRVNFGYRTAVTNAEIAKGGYTFFTIGVDLFSRPEFRDL